MDNERYKHVLMTDIIVKAKYVYSGGTKHKNVLFLSVFGPVSRVLKGMTMSGVFLFLSILSAKCCGLLLTTL